MGILMGTTKTQDQFFGRSHSVSTQIQIKSKAVTQKRVLKIRVFQKCQRMELERYIPRKRFLISGSRKDPSNLNIAARFDGSETTH